MRCVFLACPAFLGRVDGETRCGFWTRSQSITASTRGGSSTSTWP